MKTNVLDQYQHLIQTATNWFHEQEWTPFEYQKETWHAFLDGESGLVNAPTGTGKTYALGIAIMLDFIKNHPDHWQKGHHGLQAVWLTPLRALTVEIRDALQRAADGLGLKWRIAIRTTDTSSAARNKLKRSPPELLVTTPETLHLLLAQKGYPDDFAHLQAVICDEWHELIGSKRGVLVELALSRLKTLRPLLRIWGISATIGNLEQALQVLIGCSETERKPRIIRSDIDKPIEVDTLLPEEVDKFSWAGHFGTKLADQVTPIIQQHQSTLIFTNTRSQAEVWYQKILESAPELAGSMAMHHGSLGKELRYWVEDALHRGDLKAVVCTSSLDLGVDFRPVEAVMQIGGPKGVARFMQRAGRSGHQPGALSRIYFLPTHSLEIMEGAALRDAVNAATIESRAPYVRCFDVLAQYLVTLALSEGFDPEQIYYEVTSTHCYESISDDEWHWVVNFIASGGQSLHAYDEYHKVEEIDGRYYVTDKRIAKRHRLSIGTIVSDQATMVKFLSGKKLGTVEEWFITQLNVGDTFWFAGRNLKLVRLKENTAYVRRSQNKTGKTPSWQGGRMPLSSRLSAKLREKLNEVTHQSTDDIEITSLAPLVDLQSQRSHVPGTGEFLIEYFTSREGHHLVMYPFEGRFVHEVMAGLAAYRISQLEPLSFSIAMNDYGFELLSDQPIPVEDALASDFLTSAYLSDDIQRSVNASEMARHRFRDIASIAGLVFRGFPGKEKKDRHLQSSAQLFFDVFTDYEPDNLLLRQAYDEVLNYQIEEARLRQALERIEQQEAILRYPDKPTPFAFPIMVDRLRDKLSSEKLEDRVMRMKVQYEK